MTDKKKPPKKKPTKKKAKKPKKLSKKQVAEQIQKLAKICRAIAIFDLIHALYFTLEAIIGLVQQFSAVGLLALFGVAFWVANVLLLIVGLWKRKPNFVRYWILFSVAGFAMDVLFLLWGVATSITVDWDRLAEFVIIFFGIFIECGFIYIIHRYYKLIDVKGKKICCRKGDKKDKKPKKGAKKDKKKKPKKKK